MMMDPRKLIGIKKMQILKRLHKTGIRYVMHLHAALPTLGQAAHLETDSTPLDYGMLA